MPDILSMMLQELTEVLGSYGTISKRDLSRMDVVPYDPQSKDSLAAAIGYASKVRATQEEQNSLQIGRASCRERVLR